MAQNKQVTAFLAQIKGCKPSSKREDAMDHIDSSRGLEPQPSMAERGRQRVHDRLNKGNGAYRVGGPGSGYHD